MVFYRIGCLVVKLKLKLELKPDNEVKTMSARGE
ncbi:hypothetical protein SCB49_01532 [unidentified eubacterium SCB49]|nr:hypothetical protein SCB49_01532 [unidentified eubacterium SCB49]